LPHALDHVVADAAIGFGLLRVFARKLGNRAGAGQEIGNSGSATDDLRVSTDMACWPDWRRTQG
jgi:hypothetical protein